MSVRVPAPVLVAWQTGRIVTWPARQAVKSRSAKRVERKADAKDEERLTSLLARHAAALGVQVPLSPVPAEPPAPEVPTQPAVDYREEARGWLYRHRRDVGAPILGAGLTLACWSVAHVALWFGGVVGIVGVGVALAVLVTAGVWWAPQVDPEDKVPLRKIAAWGTLTAAVLWSLSPLSFPVDVHLSVAHSAGVGAAITMLVMGVMVLRFGWAPWVLGAGATMGLLVGIGVQAVMMMAAGVARVPIVPGMPAWLRWGLLLSWTGVAVWFRWGRFQPRRVQAVVVGPAERWAATHGSRGWSLEGSALLDVHRIISPDGRDIGWSATVACVPGKHNASRVKAQAEDIAGTYGRDVEHTVVERTGNALRPRLSVMEREPFREVNDWPGPSLTDDGVFQVGSYFDGEPAMMRAWTPDAGSLDFWLFGKKGSGKSTLLTNVLGSLMSRGLVVLHLTDLKGGMSVPEWAEVAFRYGTQAADGLMQLKRLDAIGRARVAAASRMTWHAPGDPRPRTGVSVLEVSQEWPLQLGVFEESPQMWRVPGALELAERITTLYRAVDVAVMFISQMAELKQAFNNSATLREQVQAGNVWGGYVGKTQGRLGFDNFDPDLSALRPNTYLSYLSSPVQTRDAVIKADRIRDTWAVARASVPGCSNAVDLEAVRAMEAEEEEKAPQPTGPAGNVTRQSVEVAALRAVEDAGGPVRLAAISSRLAPTGLDELALRRHNDLVGHYLGQLMDDPSSGIVKPKKADGTGQWGMYGVAS